VLHFTLESAEVQVVEHITKGVRPTPQAASVLPVFAMLALGEAACV
jgi:hypothetical protein